MIGAKFAKFTRDCDIVDKVITPTEVDITFNKVKGKTERKIGFSQFQEALKQISRKKFPSKSPTEAFIHLVRLVAHNGNPQVVTLVKVSRVLSIYILSRVLSICLAITLSLLNY